MDQIVTVVVPVFGLIGLGYVIAWSRILGEGTGDALAEFVFTIAIPALLFRVLAGADFSHGAPWLLWLAYYIPFAIAWVAGDLVMRVVFRRDARASLVGGVASAYGNGLLVGIPLILTGYGQQGMTSVALLIAIHLPITMVVGAVLMERARMADGVATDAPVSVIARKLALNLIRTPIIIGIVLGILWHLTGLPIAGPAGDILTQIGAAASTLALLAVGMTLRKFGVRGNVLPALAFSVIKLLLLPAMVFVTTHYFVSLPREWSAAAVIFAACPTGVNAYVIAQRFGMEQGLASNIVTITTALAVASVSLWLSILSAV